MFGAQELDAAVQFGLPVRAIENRHISATDYNEHSSRSHSIVQLVRASMRDAVDEEILG